MGIAAPTGVADAGTVPNGDQANAVLAGKISAIGPLNPFAFRGPMNVWVWASVNTTLTTNAGSTAATVGSAAGLAVGSAINGVNVPRGTTIGALVGTNVTLALPPNRTAAAILAGADAAALFTGAAVTYVGTVQLERSFDGGQTFLACNIGGTGALAQWNTGTPLSLSFGEPEANVLYRLNCIAYTSGVINYRISATGQAATSLSVPSMV